ncbi:MAG: extracellular solute-binding protein family 1, partial [Verrucomicrobiales bacterium]|nr:extracellular solute-binding protein family 1 [Verrucomicrobiales bacterium]
ARLEAISKGRSISLLTKNDYLSPAVLEEFRRQFGFSVKSVYYESDAELSDLLQREEAFDVVIANGTELQNLIKAGLLSQNTQFLTNGMRMVEGFLRKLPFDPNWNFSVPFAWTSFGTGYNTDFQTEPPASWRDLLEPDAIANDLKGKIAMFDIGRYVIGSALIYQGHSPNSTNRAEIDEATALLLRQRPLVREYNETNSRADLSGAQAFLDQSIGSDISIANTLNRRIRFALPKEGTMVMVTFLAVPKTSTRQNIAGEFIRFLLRPDVSGKNVNYSHRASALAAALPFVEREIRNGPAYSYPTETSKLFYVETLPAEWSAYYDQCWGKILRGEIKQTTL